MGEGGTENPENVNRILTDHISHLLFAVSKTEKDNLKKEGLENKTFVVGNLMYDAWLFAREKIQGQMNLY